MGVDLIFKEITFFYQKNTMLINRVIKFSITGAFVTLTHISIVVFLVENSFATPPFANGVAFVCATLISCLINTTWTFSNKLHRKVLVKYFTVTFLGLFLSVLISSITQAISAHYMVGVVATIFIIPPVNFLLHNCWTYR